MLPRTLTRASRTGEGLTALRIWSKLLCAIVFISVLIATILFSSGCGGNAEESPPTTSPTVVLGLDGLEWDIILPMLKKGQLPNFAKLMERGYYGKLKTLVPTHSPIVWTSIATGKVRLKHGIYHFIRLLPDGEMTLFNSTNRKTKAIWNILSDYGKSVNTIGWWMSYPVEAINGIMVAQTNTTAQLDTRAGKNVWKGGLLKGVANQVYPPERQNEMIAILEEVESNLTDLMAPVFGELRFPLSLLGRRLWGNCQWIFRADATYRRIALKLAQEDPQPDLTLLYFGGIDIVSHRFWRYMQPDIYRHKPSPEQIANFGTVIEDYYVYIDQFLGQLLEAYGSEVTIMIISDHGFHGVNLTARFDPADPPSDVNSGNHQDAPDAFFLAAGPHIRKVAGCSLGQGLSRQDLKTVGSVLDITPTLLAMMRIPVGKDMDGRVLTKIFRDEFQIDRQSAAIYTHDTSEFLSRRGIKALPHPGEKERLEQLRSLGYIGDEAEDR